MTHLNPRALAPTKGSSALSTLRHATLLTAATIAVTFLPAAKGKPVGMIHIGGTRPTVIMEALMPEHTAGSAPISSPGDERPQPDSTSPPDRLPARGSAR
jgi:hypothetical protein